jgi:predicted DNA-binding transcriptional regulator AlpA
MGALPIDAVLRPRQVMALLGISRTTLWRLWSRQKLLPPPLQLGPNSVGWRESELRDFLAGRPRRVVRQCRDEEVGRP